MKALLRFLMKLIPARFLFSESNEDVSSFKVASEESALSIYVDEIIQEVNADSVLEADKEDSLIEKYIARILYRVLEEEQTAEDSDITEYIDNILKAVQEQLLAEKEHIKDLGDTVFCYPQKSGEQDEVHWYIEGILTAVQQDLCAEELSYKELETESVASSVEECDDQADLESILEEVQNEFEDDVSDSDSPDIDTDFDFIMPRRGMPSVNPCSSKTLVKKTRSHGMGCSAIANKAQLVEKGNPSSLKRNPIKTNKYGKEGKMPQVKYANKMPTNERLIKNGITKDSFGNWNAENSPASPNDTAKVEKHGRWCNSGQLGRPLDNKGETIEQGWAVGENKEKCNVSRPRVPTPPASLPPPTDNTLMESDKEKTIQIAENENNDGLSKTVEDTPGNSPLQERRPCESLEGAMEFNDTLKMDDSLMKNKTMARQERKNEHQDVLVSRKSEVIRGKTKLGNITSLQEPKIVVRPTRGSHAARSLAPASLNSDDKPIPRPSRRSSSNPSTANETEKPTPFEKKFQAKKKPSRPKTRVTMIETPRKPIWERYKKPETNSAECKNVNTVGMKKVTRVRRATNPSAPITFPPENSPKASLAMSETGGPKMLPSKSNSSSETTVAISGTEISTAFPTKISSDNDLVADTDDSSKNSKEINLLDLPISEITDIETDQLHGDYSAVIAIGGPEQDSSTAPTQLFLSKGNMELLIDLGEPEFSVVGSDSLETLVNDNCSQSVDQSNSSGNLHNLEIPGKLITSGEDSLTDPYQDVSIHSEKHTCGNLVYSNLSTQGMLKPLKVQTEDSEKYVKKEETSSKQILEVNQNDAPVITSCSSNGAANSKVGNEANSQISPYFDLEQVQWNSGLCARDLNEKPKGNQTLCIQCKSSPVVPLLSNNVCSDSSHHNGVSNESDGLSGLNNLMFTQLSQFGQNRPVQQISEANGVPLASTSGPTGIPLTTPIHDQERTYEESNLLEGLKKSGEKPLSGDRAVQSSTLDVCNDVKDSAQQIIDEGTPVKAHKKVDKNCNEQRTDQVDKSDVSRMEESSVTLRRKRKSFIPIPISRLSSNRRHETSIDNSRLSVLENRSSEVPDHRVNLPTESCKETLKDGDGGRKSPVNSRSEGDERSAERIAHRKKISISVGPSTNKTFRLRTESLKKDVVEKASKKKSTRVTLKRSKTAPSPRSTDASEQSVANAKVRVSRKDRLSGEKEDVSNKHAINKRPIKKRSSSDMEGKFCSQENEKLNIDNENGGIEQDADKDKTLVSVVKAEIPPTLKPSPKIVNVLSESNPVISELDPLHEHADKHQTSHATITFKYPRTFALKDFCPKVDWSNCDERAQSAVDPKRTPRKENPDSECFESLTQTEQKHLTECRRSGSLSNCKEETTKDQRENVLKETGKQIIESYLDKQVEIRKLSPEARHREVVRWACDRNQHLPTEHVHYSSDIKLLSDELTGSRKEQNFVGVCSTPHTLLRGNGRSDGEVCCSRKQSSTATCTPLLMLLIKAHMQQLSQSYPQISLCLENYRNYYPLQRKILLLNPFCFISLEYQNELTKPVLLKALSGPMKRDDVKVTEVGEVTYQTENWETQQEIPSQENVTKQQMYPFDPAKLGIVLKWLIEKFHETSQYMHMMESQQNERMTASMKSCDSPNTHDSIAEMTCDEEISWYSVLRSSSEQGLVEDKFTTDRNALMSDCNWTQDHDTSTAGINSEEDEAIIPIFSHVEDETSHMTGLGDNTETALRIGQHQEDHHTYRFVLYSSIVMLKVESPQPRRKTLGTREATPTGQISRERGQNCDPDKSPKRSIWDTLGLRARRQRNIRRIPAFGKSRNSVRRRMGFLFGCLSKPKQLSRA